MVARGVAGGEERRLRRRSQRHAHRVFGQARDLRRAVHAAATACERVERTRLREAHAHFRQHFHDRGIEPPDIGFAQNKPA